MKHVAEQHRLPERASDAMSGVGKAQSTSVKLNMDAENQPIEKLAIYTHPI